MSLAGRGVALTLALALGQVPARAADVPRELRGTWAWDAQACRNPSSDGRLRIAREKVTFFASECRLRGGAAAGRAFRATATCTSEGKTSREALRVDRVGRSELRVRMGRYFDMSYLRCAAPR